MNVVSWTGIATLLISLGSLVVAAAGFWRSGRVRVLDLRTAVLKDAAELGIALEGLSKTVPAAVRSRTNLSAATGNTGGALQLFREEAEADLATLRGLRNRLDQVKRVRLFSSYSAIEAKAVSVNEVRTRVRHLTEKYQAAACADDKLREEHRKAATERFNKILNRSRS